jgi:heptaprenyl diphosphate synthase
MTDTETIRQKLTDLLTSDSLLSRVFPLTGDLSRAKFSRAKLLLKNALDNKADEKLAIEAAIGIEMVHLATLVHDDVIDDSNLRRNEASFRATKGDKGAVLYGDYLFSSAVRQIQNTQNQGCAKAFVGCINETCRGEAIQDLLLTASDFNPTLQIMYEVARGKTGALFSFCTEAPAWMLPNTSMELKNALREIGFLLGLGYQLADDTLDISGVEENLGKPAGNDLNQNCMTSPLFLMMNEKGDSWESFRGHYLSGNGDLKVDFLSGPIYEKVKSEITKIRYQLQDKIQICSKNNWKIETIVNIFWEQYVQKRMSLLKDLEELNQ